MGRLFDFHNSPIRSGVLAGMAMAVAIDLLGFVLLLAFGDAPIGTDGFYYATLGIVVIGVAGLPWNLIIETGDWVFVLVLLCPLPNGAIVGFMVGSLLAERKHPAVTSIRGQG